MKTENKENRSVKTLPKIIQENFKGLAEANQNLILAMDKTSLTKLAEDMQQLATDLTTNKAGKGSTLTPEQLGVRKQKRLAGEAELKAKIKAGETGKDFVVMDGKKELYKSGTSVSAMVKAIRLADGSNDEGVENGSISWRFVTGVDEKKKPVIEAVKRTAMFFLLKEGQISVEQLDKDLKVTKTFVIKSIKVTVQEELARKMIANHRVKIRSEKAKEKEAQVAGNNAAKSV